MGIYCWTAQATKLEQRGGTFNFKALEHANKCIGNIRERKWEGEEVAPQVKRLSFTFLIQFFLHFFLSILSPVSLFQSLFLFFFDGYLRVT